MRRLSSSRGKRDITIRADLSSGTKTEMSKLHHIDRYLYAWIDADQQSLDGLCVFDVKKLLASVDLSTMPKIWNADKKSAFIHFPAMVTLQDCGALLMGVHHLNTAIVQHWAVRMPTRRDRPAESD